MTLRRPTLLSAVALLAFATSCAPSAVTEEGRGVNQLYDIFFWVAAGVFSITAGLIGWSIIRYRARPGDNELPEQFHQNLPLEVTWFAIPQIIVVVLFVLSAMTLGDVNEQEAEPDVTVNVTGYQWGWRFEFEGSEAEIVGTPQEPAEIKLPTGNVAFLLRSADVVHNFYVPRFLMKRDVVPGRETRFDVDIEEPGRYGGVCAEFCGLLHDRMTFSIEAVSSEEFEAWLSDSEGAGDGNG